MKRFFVFAAMVLAAAVWAAPGAFTVDSDGKGGFVIRHRGTVLVSSVKSLGVPSAAPKAETLADGTRVWNLWNANRDASVRQEIALKADGSEVEITMIGEAEAFCPTPARCVYLSVPQPLVEGWSYEGLTVSGRRWVPVKGTFAAAQKFPSHAWRYFLMKAPDAETGVVFDLNPIGAGDFIMMYGTGCVKGVWSISQEKGEVKFTGGSAIGQGGGLSGAKVVLREGEDLEEDYYAHHALKTFGYTDKFVPQRLYCFGAVKHGTQFTDAGTAGYSASARCGWVGTPKLTPVQGAPEGAYYSAMKGRDASFRISGLTPGVHFVTVSCGNYTGVPNRFAVRFNGEAVTEGKVSVGKGELLSVTRAAWVGADGVVQVAFDGDFVVSAIGTVFFLAEAEDFSFRRGIWAADGFEPASYFRNADYRPAPKFAASVQRMPLPTPGREAPGRPRPIPRIAEQPDMQSAGLAWIYNAKFRHLGGNASSLHEYHDPAVLERKLDELQKEGATALMVSGMHSRHTYKGSLRRGQEMFRRIAEAAHRRGLKVIDHHDATLLWNLDSGFRVMAERTPETVLGLIDLMPNAQFCILNPVFTRAYRDYLLEQVRNGVDGFQGDELTFYEHGCGCQHCRAAFYEDTGWQLPMNELDKRLFNMKDPLWKYFLEWRKAKVGNWWAEFRREAKAINPDLTLCMYSTHYGFTSNYATLRLGLDLTELGRAINFFGTEIMTRNCLQSGRALLPYRKMKNLLRTAFGTPIWGWIYGGTHATNYFGWAACNMTAQSGLCSVPEKDKGADFFAFEATDDNMDRSKAENIAKVALLFSSHSRDWQFGISQLAEMFGLAQTLEELHVPYEFIGDMSVTAAQLAKYDVLFLGSNSCISDQELKVVQDFARKGGTVHLATYAAMGDEMGFPRRRWPFADLFGFTPKPQGSYGQIVKMGTTPKVSSARPLAAKQYSFVGPAKPGTTSALYGFNAAGRAYPVLFEKPFGKGRVYYQSTTLPAALCCAEGSFGKKWNFELDEGLAELARACYLRVIGEARYWRTNAPAKVYTTLYRQGDAIAVHFLNGTGANYKKDDVMTFDNPEPPWPALPEDITFTLPCAKAARVYAVSPDFSGQKPLRFALSEGKLSVTLPKELLKAYTIVWIR